MPELSIISVTYNSESYLKRYLLSVAKALSKDTEWIIIDNCSTDKTVPLIKQLEEGLIQKKILKVIPLEENKGFSYSNNLATSEAKGEYLFFLNPDTEIIDDAVERLLNFAKTHDVGIVAPKLIEPNGKTQPTVRAFPNLWGAIKEYIFGFKDSYEPFVPETDHEIEVPCVLGAAVMIKRDLFMKLGGFDERYFMYFEDLELCRKVKREGKKIIYLPQVLIKHLVGGSKEPKKTDWIRQSEKVYYGSVQAYLIGLIGRLGNKLFKRNR